MKAKPPVIEIEKW